MITPNKGKKYKRKQCHVYLIHNQNDVYFIIKINHIDTKNLLKLKMFGSVSEQNLYILM